MSAAEMMKKYVINRRTGMALAGNVVLALGVAAFRLSGMGNDPFSGMTMAVAGATGVAYPTVQALINVVLFGIQVVLGRELIGEGSVINAFLLACIVQFFYGILTGFTGGQMNGTTIGSLPMQLICVVIGVLVASLGLSLYQSADAGVSPYDALSLIAARRQKKIPYFWLRMATDVTCAVICFAFGGIIGLGTLVSTFGFGPFIGFFNRTVTAKLLGQEGSSAESAQKSGKRVSRRGQRRAAQVM